MKICEEVRASLYRLGSDGAKILMFEGLSLPEETTSALMASLLAGHHMLLVGPPGVGKTTIAQRMVRLLSDRQAVLGCPVNCDIAEPVCPWCIQRLKSGETLTSTTLSGSSRMCKIMGSPELNCPDVMGDIDPQMALRYGMHDLRAFVPGKLLRANSSMLLLDFIDRLPERVLNGVLSSLTDGMIMGVGEHVFPVDVLVIATATASPSEVMPLDLSDYFDVVPVTGVAERRWEAQLLSGNRDELGPSSEAAMEIVQRTRHHEDLCRGVSLRGVIRYGELLRSYQEIASKEHNTSVLPAISRVTLPHRVKVAPHAMEMRSARDIIEEIVSDVLGAGRATCDEPVELSREALSAVVEEIARCDHFRKPLKFGFFDLLLKRIKRYPEAVFSQLYTRVLGEMELRYKERHLGDNVTFELLRDIEEARERQERLSAELRARLEAEAVVRTVGLLEERGVLVSRQRGYTLSGRGIALLLEKLVPRFWEGSLAIGSGKHATGKKCSVGDGRIIGTRSWRCGDRYRDISLKDTIRKALRNRHRELCRDDIQVVTRDIRARMDIVLCLDLSGTMSQLDKLWYAKESAIALSLASSMYGDRVGIVTFSNLASVVSDLTTHAYRLTERILELDLHENAFTNIGYALATARVLFGRHSRSRGQQHIILVSDGDATAPHPSPATYATRQAARCVRKGITISCICINEENADPHLMRAIARIGRGRITVIEEPGALRSTIIEEMRRTVR